MSKLAELKAQYAKLGEEIAKLEAALPMFEMVDIPNRAYQMGKYTVTQREWVSVMGTNPSHFKGDNLPVENVSYNDVLEFIKRLNEKTGENYRLPSEDEWEYCAKGGYDFSYAGSDDADEVAWHYGNSEGKTHPVGQKKPNGFGLYDMSGNVWEWTTSVWK